MDYKAIILITIQVIILIKIIHNEYRIRKIIERTKIIVEENNKILN